MMQTYIRNHVVVKAKVFQADDQDGYVKGIYGEKVPYVRTKDGNTYAEFGSHYYVIEPNGDKLLIPLQRFEVEYSELTNY